MVAYTPTFTGFGTVTNIEMYSCRVGSNLYIKGKFTVGTPTGVEAQMTLGFNGTSANVTSATRAQGIVGAGNAYPNVVGAVLYTLVESGVTYLTFGGQNAGVAALTKQLGTGIFSAGEIVSIDATVAIAGW